MKDCFYSNIKPVSAAFWGQNTGITKFFFPNSTLPLGNGCEQLWKSVNPGEYRGWENTEKHFWMRSRRPVRLPFQWEALQYHVTRTLGNMLFSVTYCENKHGCSDAFWWIPKWMMTGASDWVSVEHLDYKNIKRQPVCGEIVAFHSLQKGLHQEKQRRQRWRGQKLETQPAGLFSGRLSALCSLDRLCPVSTTRVKEQERGIQQRQLHCLYITHSRGNSTSSKIRGSSIFTRLHLQPNFHCAFLNVRFKKHLDKMSSSVSQH